jgi:hypothetical protein
MKIVEVICRQEAHYACGCSTIKIERVQGPSGSAAHCAGHGEPMIKTITTNEYVLKKSDCHGDIMSPRNDEMSLQRAAGATNCEAKA